MFFNSLTSEIITSVHNALEDTDYLKKAKVFRHKVYRQLEKRLGYDKVSKVSKVFPIKSSNKIKDIKGDNGNNKCRKRQDINIENCQNYKSIENKIVPLYRGANSKAKNKIKMERNKDAEKLK